MGTPARNGVVTVDNNETTPLLLDYVLGGFTKPRERESDKRDYSAARLSSRLIHEGERKLDKRD